MFQTLPPIYFWWAKKRIKKNILKNKFDQDLSNLKVLRVKILKSMLQTAKKNLPTAVVRGLLF